MAREPVQRAPNWLNVHTDITRLEFMTGAGVNERTL